MNITIVSGIGTADTLLSSFDAALKDCGVYNYNIIPLSSVIPPGTTIIQSETYDTPEAEFGHRLYVVKADMRSDQVGHIIAAGIGWYQWGDGRGVFVEHETIGRTQAEVDQEMHFRIAHSLKDLCQFRNIPFDEVNIGQKIVSAHVTDRPASVLALAVYKAEGWKK